MFQLIFTNLLFLSVGVILWLFVRALPRIEKGENVKTGLIEKWITSELPEKFDYVVNNFLMKFFRKLKLYTLKFDNIVGERLKRMKWNDTQSINKPDFSSITSEPPKDKEEEKEITETEPKNQD